VAVDSSVITRDFSQLVEWIVTELATIAKLEERVRSIDSEYAWLVTSRFY